MSTSNNSPSHMRDLVAQIVHDDPEKAAALFQILVLADSSTPKGAAIRDLVMKDAFFYMEECDSAMKKSAALVAA